MHVGRQQRGKGVAAGRRAQQAAQLVGTAGHAAGAAQGPGGAKNCCSTGQNSRPRPVTKNGFLSCRRFSDVLYSPLLFFFSGGCFLHAKSQPSSKITTTSTIKIVLFPCQVGAQLRPGADTVSTQIMGMFQRGQDAAGGILSPPRTPAADTLQGAHSAGACTLPCNCATRCYGSDSSASLPNKGK